MERAEFDVKRENSEVIKFHLKSGAEEIGEMHEVQRFAFPRWKFPAFKEANIDRFKMHRYFWAKFGDADLDDVKKSLTLNLRTK